MDCERALILLSARLDGEMGGVEVPETAEIPETEQAELEAHLSGCPTCRESLASLERQDRELRREFQARREAARSLAEGVIRQYRSESKSSTALLRRRPWLTVILSAAAGFIAAALILRPGAPPPVAPVAGPPLVKEAPGAKDSAPKEPASPRRVQLAFASDRIEVLPPGATEWKSLATGDGIEPGSRVRTGGRARCEFRTPDGSEVRLNHATELLFRSARRIELARGEVWSSVEEDQEPYAVHVPHAEATITALGTRFNVKAGSDETTLTVVQGVTRVDDRGGREVAHVRSGEQARIASGIVKKSPARDLVLATSWVHEILVMKGHDNEELKRRIEDLFAQIGESKMSFLAEEEILALGDHCVRPLYSFIQSELSRKNARQRDDAARILQKIAVPWSIPLLVDLLDDESGEVRAQAARALKRLADGQTQGIEPDEWRSRPPDARDATRRKWQTWIQQNRALIPKEP